MSEFDSLVADIVRTRKVEERPGAAAFSSVVDNVNVETKESVFMVIKDSTAPVTLCTGGA